jgi:hypothetical protein
VHIADFPAYVVKVLIRYFYYHTFDISERPQAVDPFTFNMQVRQIALLYQVEPLHQLTKEYLAHACDPEHADDFVAALEGAHGRGRSDSN